MLQLGVIEPSRSPWRSPVVLVPKPDGSVRFCIDFREVNRIAQFDAYPMPRAETLIDQLGTARYLTALDLTKGYCPDWPSHMQHLRRVLQALDAAGLRANPQKSRVGFQEVKYLGFIVGRGVLRPVPEKVATLEDCPRPATKKQLRRFLGLVGYYSKFIPNFASRASPLTDLLWKGLPPKLPWTATADEAFRTLRVALSNAPVLHNPNFNEPFVVHTDASDTGLGAVLSQEIDGVERPILFLSRKLQKAERQQTLTRLQSVAMPSGICVDARSWQNVRIQTILTRTNYASFLSFSISLLVGQRETANVILKEESAENMDTKTPESTDETNVDDDPKDLPGVDKQLPTPEEKAEEQEQPSESPSNDVGFKKVFKFVGFKFTVRKDKTEKSEPVQLLNVKADDTEVAADGAGDCKEVKKEMVEEVTQSEVSHPVEKTEQETHTEQVKEEASSEKLTESTVEPTERSKEAEVKSDGSKLVESPTSPLANETASPLRKFFTQGWAGFRKKTSFRKPKEEDQTFEREKQDQEKDVTKEENAIKEELVEEKTVPVNDGAEIFVEPMDEKVKKESEEREEAKIMDVSKETCQVEPIPLPSQEFVKSVNKESEICLTEKIGLVSKEKSEPMQECLISLEQSTLPLSEEKNGVLLATEICEAKIDKHELPSPLAVEKTEDHFEMLEDKLEPKAPLATESFDEIPKEFNSDVSTIVKTEEVKINKKELTLEQLVEKDAQIQSGQPAEERLKVKETIPVAVNEQIKQTEPSSGDTAMPKPLESITNEAELLSSQERSKIQGSPLKKLFTSTSLKKLSGKKHKVKREEAKSGESVEQTQQLSDSAESPEEQKGDSSASSPEETIELSSVDKVIEAVQVTETEEGASSDMEKKRESVTPWASFKKMVTPKKRVRRLSESDKEDELEKVKSATLSSTESAPCEELEDDKENGEEQKLEKSTDEPKRKVDTSVSWEALICVGSSKKRARKSSSSDEEVGQRLAQEGQKIEEAAHKEIAPDMTFTSSQESDQGQGNSSPEQAGSPSEGEGVSTWESFKRLVTPRRKSKTKMEDRTEELVTVPSLEHSASDGDSGKEESWVSFKKLMPGRRKKKSDGIPEHAPVEEVGEETAENNEEDYDVPAVVPLSEYEAAEQEKFEAQKAKQDDVTEKKTLNRRTEESKDALVDEQASEGLVHAVTVTVVEGERAITSIEERSPSWISAAITESIEHVYEDEEKQTEQISKTGIGEEIAVVTKHEPEIRKDISGDSSELELTSEAVTAGEEASGIEEVTEVSCAEETTEMVSAVSRLTESPDTTEVATPVQETEGQQNLEELNMQTQEVLQEVAERVKLSSEEQLISGKVSETVIQSLSVEKSRQEVIILFPDAKLAESLLKVEEPEKTDIQRNEGTESDHSQDEVKGSGLKEVLEKSKDTYTEEKEREKEIIYVDGADESCGKNEQERHEEITKEQTIEEKSEEEDFAFVTVTADEKKEEKIGETVRKQQHISLERIEKEEYGTKDAGEEVTVNVEEIAHGDITEDDVPEVDGSMKRINEEKTQLSPDLIQMVIVPEPESENAETSTAEVNKAPMQNEVKDDELFIQPTRPEELVPDIPIQIQAIDVPVQNVVNKVNPLDITKDVALGLETEITEKVATGSCLQNNYTDALLHNMETEMPVKKIEPDFHLQKLETEIPVADVKLKPHLLNTETQIHVETVETEINIRKMDVEVHRHNAEIEALVQMVETVAHEEMGKEPCLPNVEAQVLAEKAEVIVEMKLSSEKTEEEIPTEKAVVLSEEVEAEVPTEKGDTNIGMEFHVEITQNEMETEVPGEKADGNVHVEASTEKIDAEVEIEAQAEMADLKVDVDASVAKVVVEASIEKEDMKFHAKEREAEFTKEVEMKVLVDKVDVKDLTEDTQMEFPTETIEVLTEKAEVDIPSEKVDAKVNTRVLTKIVDVEAKQSEEVVEGETAAKLAEQKKTLQNMEAEVNGQSETEDTMNSIISVESPVCVDLQQAPVVGDVTRVPVQREMQDVASFFQTECLDSVGSEGPLEFKDDGLTFEPTSTKQAITEEPVERGSIKVSTHKQEAIDFTQHNIADAKLALKSQHIEETFPKTSDLKDVLESKCTEETITETPVQTETIISCMEIEGEASKCLDNSASEGLMQSQKEDALTLKSNFTEAELTEDVVKKEATVDSMRNKFGNTELTIKSRHADEVVTEVAAKTEVKGDILVSDSRCTQNVSESCQKSQEKVVTKKSEKVVTVETEKSAENVELAAGSDVLYATPMQQHTFTKQEEIVVTTDIPEMQSYEASKSSVPVTAAAIEEQIIEECVTVKETSTETLQSFLEEPKETEFKIIQQVTFAQSGLGALDPYAEVISWTEKRESSTKKPALLADGLIQTQVFDSIPEVKHQKSELCQETEKQVQSAERSPSLTHIEFQKDCVQSMTIESQSTNIVLKIIQNAVDKLEKTEETASVSSLMCENECEIQESIHTDQQLLPVNTEKQETLTTEEKVTFDMSEYGEIWDSRSAGADLEAGKHISQSNEQLDVVATLVQGHSAVNEAGKEITEEPSLQKENSETKLDSEVGAAVPIETERVTVEAIVSEDLLRETLDTDCSKLKGVEDGQTVQMQEHFVEHQTHVKRKDQSTGFEETQTGKDVNNEDCTSSESPQLKSELTES
ncbi:A-kinase anchor protein 12-like [Eublepharis macularius]|uniref:A-kinase anchor protein 12-like n=1 Tax=Eublepharis macularius TaxID=481883 RepID=A0AA97IYJ5_EUBMA|nr:A-kinase anchor protein 12-like [Eublepharis macularius]